MDLPIMLFLSPKEWEDWLSQNYTKDEGLWLQMYKKASGKTSVTYAEALDVALCYGWIDGLKKRFDEESFIQKFTPRRKRSLWSQRNIEHVARLLKDNRIQAAGLAEIERAKQDGRWQAAYAPPSKAEVPADFIALLTKNKKAEAFFKTLNKTNRYAIIWRLETAKKPETKERRMNGIIAMLAENKKIY